jgi:hypothetical protein
MVAKLGSIVFIRYQDHVLYHRGDPLSLKPQVRECVGWLVYDCADYIIICWDRDARPPVLKAGDSKASGLVVMRSDILETKRIAQTKQRHESDSGLSSHFFSKTEQPNSE